MRTNSEMTTGFMVFFGGTYVRIVSGAPSIITSFSQKLGIFSPEAIPAANHLRLLHPVYLLFPFCTNFASAASGSSTSDFRIQKAEHLSSTGREMELSCEWKLAAGKQNNVFLKMMDVFRDYLEWTDIDTLGGPEIFRERETPSPSKRGTEQWP